MIFLLARMCQSPLVVVDVLLHVVGIVHDVLVQQQLMLQVV